MFSEKYSLRFEKRKLTEEAGLLFYAVLAIAVPLIGSGLFLLAKHVSPSELYLPCSQLNDELSYWKQFSSTVQFGMPRGYFGYNESTAAVGTFGPWSPLFFYLYYPIFRIFPLTDKAFFVCNIVLWSAALFFCFIILRPGKSRSLLLCTMCIAHASVLRYVFSVSPEFIIILLCFVLTVLILKFWDNPKSNVYFLASLGVIAVLTLIRGFYAAFGLMLIPPVRKSAGKMITLIAALIGFCIAYLAVMKNFTSPYFVPLIDTTIFTDIIHDPIYGILRCVRIVYHAAARVLNYLIHSETNYSVVRMWYLIFLAALFSLGLLGIVQRELFALGVTAVNSIIIIAIWLLYDIDTGSRHLLAPGLVCSVVLILKAKKPAVSIAMILLIFASSWLLKNDFAMQPPAYSEQYAATLNEAAEELKGKMPLEDDPWDNTVIWSESCYFNDLYALPTGMGLNYSMEGFVLNNSDTLQSRYIAISDSASPRLLALAEEKNWICLLHYSSTYIFEIR